MANTLDPMDLKQIITLHLDWVSVRQKTDAALGISRKTVITYAKRFKASGHFLKILAT